MAVRATSWLSSVCSRCGRIGRGTAGAPRAADARRDSCGGDRCAAWRRRIADAVRHGFQPQDRPCALFTLADPYRVVPTFAGDISVAAETGEAGRGLIRAFRFGLVMQGGSRMVFDLAKPARIEKAFVVDATDGAPARLVLDLVATTAKAFCGGSPSTARSAAPICRARKGWKQRNGDPRPLVVLDRATAASTPAPRGRAA